MKVRAVGVFARVLLAVGALAVVAALALGWVLTSAFTGGLATLPGGSLDGLANRPAEEPGDPLTVLLIGTDSRADEPEDGGVTGQRADAMMVLRVAPDSSRADLISLPRDSWVDLPGHGQAKANAALALGGVPLTTQLVETLTGWRVDHVAVVDFTAVREITTQLGGVEVDNYTNAPDPRTGRGFPAGKLTLAGDDALEFVRQRYGLPNGDLDRIDRQQQLIKGIVAKTLTGDTLANPNRLRLILSALGTHATVDADLAGPAFNRVAAQIAAVPGTARTFYTAPTLGPGRSPDGQSYLVLDTTALKAACADIAAGRTPTLPNKAPTP
ncbi:LCP family protein [Actinokineospora bangkokensis]|nr:LCP family protein [Actinokineospora bangkokensis]